MADKKQKRQTKKSIINYMNVLFHAADEETLAEMAQAVGQIAKRSAEAEEKPVFMEYAV